MDGVGGFVNPLWPHKVLLLPLHVWPLWFVEEV